MGGDKRASDVKAGKQKGLVLSLSLFEVVMETIIKEVWEGLPYELSYADDLILMAESEESNIVKMEIMNMVWEEKA